MVSFGLQNVNFTFFLTSKLLKTLGGTFFVVFLNLNTLFPHFFAVSLDIEPAAPILLHFIFEQHCPYFDFRFLTTFDLFTAYFEVLKR